VLPLPDFQAAPLPEVCTLSFLAGDAFVANHLRHGSEFLKFAALAAGFISGASLATAQQSAPAPPISLQAYTAPDQSASVGVPAGWKVTKGDHGVIQMSGPHGDAPGVCSKVII
jgi:hypothetical protein